MLLLNFINKVNKNFCYTVSCFIVSCNKYHTITYTRYFRKEVNIGGKPLLHDGPKRLKYVLHENNIANYQQSENAV